MSLRKCDECGSEWPGEKTPYCPNCVAKYWIDYPRLFKPKHNPRLLPLAMKLFRSVVTEDFITDKNLFAATISQHGSYFFDTQKYYHVTALNLPLGAVPGSTIPAHSPWPTYPLDSVMVVNSLGKNPQVLAVNIVEIIRDSLFGRLIPSQICVSPRCTNLSLPGFDKCEFHFHKRINNT